jgi:hypothetical protein
MSAYMYDKAITELFESITGDSIFINPPEMAIRNTSQLNGDRIKFPLISLNRTGFSIRQEELNFNALHQGATVRVNKDNTVTNARIIPIRLEYQVDVFTVDKKTNDEIIRELVFYLYLHPTLTAKIDYGLAFEHKFNLFLDADIQDNSDVVGHIDNGVLFRNTFTMYSPDACLWSSKDFKSPFLDITSTVLDKNNKITKEYDL